MEWTQRTPLTGDNWQEIWINLLPYSLDQIRIDDGEPFPVGREAFLHLAIPILVETPPVPLVFGTCGSASISEMPFDSVLSRSRWHRVAVQIFPSGGCDLRVDGELVARARSNVVESFPSSLRLAIGGRSVGADMLIGEVSVYEGIRYPSWRE